MAHYVEASYNEADATFLPPLRTLGFNPQLKLNDSLLVQSYIEAYDISYPEALRRVEAEVRELRQHLETERQYELHDIGLLHYNEEGKLEFEPCEAGILTPQLYGLSSFELPRRVAAVTRPASSAAPTPLPEEHAITIKISWLRNMVAAAAAIVAFLMIGTPVSHQNNMLQSGLLTTGSAPAVTAPSVTAEPVLPESTTINMPTADSVEKAPAAESESVTAERSEVSVPATPSQPAVLPSAWCWHARSVSKTPMLLSLSCRHQGSTIRASSTASPCVAWFMAVILLNVPPTMPFATFVSRMATSSRHGS